MSNVPCPIPIRKRKRASLERLMLDVLRVRMQARRPVPGLRRLLGEVDRLYAASGAILEREVGR